jgi:hypothetical protein
MGSEIKNHPTRDVETLSKRTGRPGSFYDGLSVIILCFRNFKPHPAEKRVHFALFIFLLYNLPMKIHLLFSCFLIVLLAACTPGEFLESTLMPSPTDTPIFTPTSTHTSTPTPFHTKTTTPTSTIAIGYQSESACDLPYAPLRTGTRPYVRDFQVVTGAIETTVVTGDNHFATAVITINKGEWGGSEVSFECDSSGVVQLSSSGFGWLDPGKTIPSRSTLVSNSGMINPPADQWKVGTSWEVCQVTHVEQGVEYTDEYDYEWCVSYSISSQEMVEVEGKSVEAFRVEGAGSTDYSNYTEAYSCLYAYGIGRISCESK